MYNLHPKFEESVTYLAVTSKPFWQRIGSRVDPEKIKSEACKTLLKVAKAVAAERGYPTTDEVLQRTWAWQNEGKIAEDTVMKMAEILTTPPDMDPERIVHELLGPVKKDWQQAIAQQVMKRYSSGSDFGSLPDEMLLCDRLGDPVADVEVQASELIEDTEDVNRRSPIGETISYGLVEMDAFIRPHRGSFTTLLMDSKAGKSMTLCHWGAAAALQGENVAYLSLELETPVIHNRILAAVTGMSINEITYNAELRKEAIKLWKDMKARRKIGRVVVEKFPAGSVNERDVVAWFRAQERLKKERFPVRIVDYGDLVVSTHGGDRDSAYNHGKTVWTALFAMANEDPANWVYTATQAKRPTGKPGEPLTMLTRAAVADSAHKYRIPDFFITMTAQPDVKASAGHLIYFDADRHHGMTGELVGPVPHYRAIGRMGDMSHL